MSVSVCMLHEMEWNYVGTMKMKWYNANVENWILINRSIQIKYAPHIHSARPWNDYNNFISHFSSFQINFCFLFSRSVAYRLHVCGDFVWCCKTLFWLYAAAKQPHTFLYTISRNSCRLNTYTEKNCDRSISITGVYVKRFILHCISLASSLKYNTYDKNHVFSFRISLVCSN